MDANVSTRTRANRVALGGWLVLAGVLMLLDRVVPWDIGGLGRLWPWLLVAMGATRLLMLRGEGGCRGGFWLLVIGLWFAADYTLGYRVHHTWPLIVVAAGVSIVWGSLGRDHGRGTATEADHV